jgi:hypothetical protein
MKDMKLQRFVNDIENQIINLKNKYLKPKYVSVNKKGMEIFKKIYCYEEQWFINKY